MRRVENIYNIDMLIKSARVDALAGIRQVGSRHAYFALLNSFEANVPNFLLELNLRDKKTLYSKLTTIRAKLSEVRNTEHIDKVDNLLALIRDGKTKNMSSQLLEFKMSLGNLCRKIREADISYVKPAKQQEDLGVYKGNLAGIYYPKQFASDAGYGRGDGMKKDFGERQKGPIRAGLFANLLGFIEKYEFDFAVEEVKMLMCFTYDTEIDRSLKNIASRLNVFDYAGALNEARQLFDYSVHWERGKENGYIKKKILAIDDVPDSLNIVKKLLKEEYNVYCVTNYTAVLKFLSKNIPDLILLDVEMPDMDGFELLRLIRQIDACNKLPVLFLTGNVNLDNIMASVEAGGDDFIKKPVEYDVLVDKIEKHLRLAR